MAPQKNGKTLTCANCGNDFYVPASQFKYRNPRFCSHKCASAVVNSSQSYKDNMRKTALSLGYGKHMKGRQLTQEHKDNISAGSIGKHTKGGWKLSDETRRNISDGHKGDKSHLWKGGVTKISAMIRTSFEYKEWRKKVFERDGYCCVLCGKKGKIQADHIKQFAKYPELRFDIDNGRTLCESCHRKTPNYGRLGR